MPSSRREPGRRQRRQPAHRAGAIDANHDGFNSPRHSSIAVAMLCAVHSLALTLLFQPFHGWFDTNPVVDQDWGLHFHHLRALERFWNQDRALTGYNPLFMAGYPSNTIQDLSIKFFEFAALVLSQFGLTPTRGFKLTAFVAMSSAPWILYRAARNFFYDSAIKPFIALAAGVLGTAYWWNSLPREMFFYGMIGFPVAAYASVWGTSLIYRVCRQGRSFTPTHIAWLIFAALILPLHVQAVLILLTPLLALSLFEPKFFTRKVLVSILGAAVLSLAVNWRWLILAIAHRGDDVSSALVDQLPLFASMDIFTFIMDYLGTRGYWTFRPSFLEKGFRCVLLILGILGVSRLIHSESRSLGLMLAGGLTGLFLLTYFGAFIPLARAWQPLRFKIPFDLFLIIGAAYAIARQLHGRSFTKPPVTAWLIGVAAIAFLLNVLQTESSGRMRLRSQLHPDLLHVIEWIKRETPADGRILFEESGDETGFVHDGVYLSNFVASGSGRQLIGGPINLYNDRHHFAEFHSGKIFKRDIGTLSFAELRNYLSLYNIGAIAAFHPASIKRFHAIAGLVTFEQRIGQLHLFKVNQALTWFVEGRGKVTAQLNRLELSEIEGNPIILKYHWVAGLKSEPAAKIEPVHMADDPIPFIKISDPPNKLVLRLGS